MFNEKLYTIIKDKVYEDQLIKEVSKNSTGKETDFVFDFKVVSLDKDFLEPFAQEFWGYISKQNIKEIQVGGMESGALPLLASISLNKPKDVEANFFYVRKNKKKNDLANNIEGQIRSDKPCVLIDDILNYGNTLRKQVSILRAEGYKVQFFFVCLRFRDFSYYSDFAREDGIQINSVFELNDFSNDLPVKNLQSIPDKNYWNKYKVINKTQLTTKPNLYDVVPKSAPLLVANNLYVGTDDGRVICLDVETQKLVWEFKVLFGSAGKFIFSSPNYVGDYLIFGAYDGNIYCLNRFTGKKIWVNMEADWVGSSPAIDKQKYTVYVGLEFGLFNKRGGLIAIDIRTGKKIWCYKDVPALIHASPAFNSRYKLIICGDNNGVLRAFSTKDGKVIWEFKTNGAIKYGIVFSDNLEYLAFGSFDRNVYILCVKDGSIKNQFETKGEIYSTPIFIGKLLIVGSLDKNIYGFDTEKDETIWKCETGGRIFCSPHFSERQESVFIGSNDGVLYEIDYKTGKIEAKVQLPDRIVNRVQIKDLKAGIEIFVATHAGSLFKLKSQNN